MDNEEKKYFRDIKMALRKLSGIGVPVTSIIKAVMNAESELAESEDERIRKSLVEFLTRFHSLGNNGNYDNWSKADCSDWIAWLEKQKEPKHEPEDLQKSFEMGQQSIINNPEKYGLCKPAEWSEEDEKMVRFWNMYYEHKVGDWSNKDVVEHLERFREWLNTRFKSLRPQPKQEWSEEDDEMCLHIRLIVNMCNAKSSTIGPMLKWLNDLHKRIHPSWKPSEEQMEELGKAKDMYMKSSSGIASLYYDLKTKLM